MAHVAKYTNIQCGHLLNHYNRKDERECNRSNEDIDKTRTKENYNLMKREESPQEIYKNRLGELYSLGRADVKTMCDWVITLPKDYNGNEREFFVHTTDFLNNRYGANNCVGAFVHVDEKQQHMHYSFIPVVEDKNPNHKQQEKVCAKEVLTRSDLTSFHDDLQRYLRDKMPDREINIVTGITKEQGRNMSVREIKLKAKSERLKEKEKNIAEREKSLDSKERRLINRRKRNLEQLKRLDKQKIELERKEVGLTSKEKDLFEREKDILRIEQRQKEFREYLQCRENYCTNRGMTEVQYERECFQAKIKGELKPYPEIINPTLSSNERKEIRQGYKEQQERQKECTRNQEREILSR